MIITNPNAIEKSMALLLADLHLHQKPDWRFIYYQDFIEELLASDFRCLPLILLGDVFEVKDKLDSRVINQFLNLVLKWSEKHEVIWIVGQHDSYIPGVATLEGLQHVPNIHIVSKDIYTKESVNGTNDFCCVPYMRDLDDYRKLLKSVPNNATILTHIPIVEALIQIGAQNVDGISVEEFKRFKTVISGDIHNYVDIKNFHYVGATSQRDWRDKNVEPQIGIFTTEHKLVRIPLIAPEHIEIKHLQQLKSIEASAKQCVIKILTEKMDLKQLAAVRKLPNVLNVIWEPPIVEIIQTSLPEQTALTTPSTVLQAHLEQAERPADTTIEDLFEIGTELLDNTYKQIYSGADLIDANNETELT